MSHLKGLIRKHTVRWIYNKIRHRIPSMILMALCTIISAYLGVKFAFITKVLIDGATNSDYDVVVWACVTLICFVVVRTGLSVLGIHISDKLVYDMERDFKRNLFHTVLTGNYADMTKYHTGDLIVRINGDASQVYGGVLSMVSSVAGLITSLVTAMVMLNSIATGFMIVMVCGSAVIALFTLLIQRKMKQLQLQGAKASSKVTGFIQESISKLLIVQALDVSKHMECRAENLLEEKWQVQRKRKNINILMNLGASLLAYVGSFAALLWCVVELYHGRITFGTLTATTALVAQLQGPLMALPKLIPQFVTITTAAERLMELEDIPPQEPSDPSLRSELYESMTGISAKDLTFAYDRSNVLEQISCNIPKGAMTVITGSSGIGKSTLLKLLLGVYRPNSGELVIDTASGSIPVSRATRCLFTFVPQGNLLLSGTIRENLVLCKPEATEAEIRSALYISALEDCIASLPEGLDTPLGENAAGLSEGQAQRLSLARALLSEAPILLLDEVTSSLDGETERVVLERIRALPDRTCIVVTHRPAVLELADFRLHFTEGGAEISPTEH